MTMPRPPLPRTLVLASIVALFSACSHKPVESVATEEEVPVSVKPATLVPAFETTVTATGVVAAESGFDWTITAPESARIAELPRNEGERVKAGDLLVRFEIPALSADVTAKEADVAQAGAKVDTAKAALARTTGLVERGIGAKKDQEAAALDLAQADAALKQAHAALDAAYVMQSRAIVKARFPGIIAKRWHGAGDLVETGGTVVRVIDPSRLEVVASVTVGDLGRVSLGRAVSIESAAGVEPEHGTVVSAPAAIDPASATADVRIKFSAPTHLAAGQAVSATIVAERLTNVIVIPTVGIIHDGDEVFVMVAGEDDDKAHKTPVTLGASASGMTVVKTGLKAGNLVIVRGQDGLPDEAAIVVIK
ncbi:MAG TPA: efflux RND transporter periplasmic adaptor subunit [Vicinamibacterales bacterium]|nr:efflux RND transporter periplasmic adaptor subunit [Vicinamibacterales bacterium]